MQLSWAIFHIYTSIITILNIAAGDFIYVVQEKHIKVWSHHGWNISQI